MFIAEKREEGQLKESDRAVNKGEIGK